jgi:hypothetical protein
LQEAISLFAWPPITRHLGKIQRLKGGKQIVGMIQCGEPNGLEILIIGAQVYGRMRNPTTRRLGKIIIDCQL